MVGTENVGPLLLQGGSMGAGFGGAFFALRWAATFIADRHDKREEQISQSTKFIIDELKESVSNLRDRMNTMSLDLEECRRGHAERDAEIYRMKAMLQGYGDARQEAALIVAADKAKSKGMKDG